MGLLGTVTVRVSELDEETQKWRRKKRRIKGKDFGLEEGGDFDASFIYIYFDSEMPFKIVVSFATAGSSISRWNLYAEWTSDDIEVEILDDELEVPDSLFNYEPSYD